MGKASAFFCCYTLPVLLFAFSPELRAQQAAISGVVADAVSGRPVPFAVVEIRAQHVGVQTNEQGTFRLDLPPALAAADSLRVSSLGFNSQVLALPIASPCRLVLQPLAVALPEAVVRPSATLVVRLGPAEAGDKFGFGGGAKLGAETSTGWQVARHFPREQGGFIQAVRFYVKPNPQCGKASVQAPFRVRVYAADGPGGTPGTDLLINSLLSTATKPGWHEVDLSNLQLRIPADGFFVAMEWLYTKPEFGCEYSYTNAKKEKTKSRDYGQSLGGYLNTEPQAAWYLSAGYPWQQFKADRFMNRGNPNAAIQAIIQPE